MSQLFDVQAVRAQFPALSQCLDGQPVVFLDNPGGTQVHQSVIDAVRDYYLYSNSNHGGAFVTSQRSDEILHEAHQAMADMLNASSPDEIVFGPNMTTLTLGISRALAQQIYDIFHGDN